MSALEQWLMEMLLAQDIAMLRAEADIKAKVIALLMTMQRSLVGLIANSPDVSDLTKANRNTLLREATAMIDDYYARAQLELDLRLVAEVESLATKDALMKLVDMTPGAPLPAAPELRAAIESVRAAAAASESATAAAIEIRLGVALPTENYLKTLASNALIQGAPSRDWWARQAADTVFKLRAEISTGAAMGETNQQIIKRIVGEQVTAKAPAGFVGPPGVMPLARKNAASIVQTAMQTVAAEARRKSFELNRDLTNGIMQVSTLDSHTSLICLAYDGAQWDHDYEPMNGNTLPYNGGVPRHWNCLPGNTPVLARSAITGVSKRWFDGEVVVIRTASGRELTSTPNHPILTSHGWIASRFINVGGDVVCDGGSEWRGVGDSDHQDMPSSIEDKFCAFFAARKVLPVPVPLSAKDFHGDGIGSKVAVVWTESFLGDGGNASLSEHSGKAVLVGGSELASTSLACGGAQCTSFNATSNAPNCRMGSASESGTLLRSGESHSGELLLAPAPCVDAVAAQNLGNGSDRNAKSVIDAANTDARSEQGDDILISKAGHGKIAQDCAFQFGSNADDAGISKNGCNHFVSNTVLASQFPRGGAGIVCRNNDLSRQRSADFAAQGDAIIGQDVENGFGADAELARNILDGESGAVFLDDVVSVCIRSFSGHVYNLETVDGWYSGNGIVTHNCRSSEIPLMKTFREMGIDLDEPEVGTRASSSGQIGAAIKMNDYLMMMGETYQNEVLGKGRAELFRAGKLKPRDLVDMSGNPIKLADLREKYATP